MKKLLILSLFFAFPALAYDDVEAAKTFANCMIKNQRQNHYQVGTALVQSCQPEYRDFIHYCGDYQQCNTIAAQAVYSILKLDAQGKL